MRLVTRTNRARAIARQIAPASPPRQRRAALLAARQWRRFVCGLIGSLVLGMLTTSLWASPQAVAACRTAGHRRGGSAPVDAGDRAARRADVESATSLPDEIKTKLKQQLDRAAEFLGQRLSSRNDKVICERRSRMARI